MILKEYEDKDRCKGGGSVQEISRLMKIFKKNDGEVCHGKLRGQHTFRTYVEDAFRAKWTNINSKKNTSLTSLME